MVTNSDSAQRYLDLDNDTVSREIFIDGDIYRQELEQIFARTWLFVGHESQVPNPNDFVTSRMGEESVILTRSRQGEIQVLLNTCRHRGMKVCRYDLGNTPVFSCPYHGWSYSTDGKLVSVPGELLGVPQFATAYHGELKKEEWGLIGAPKVEVYKGSVWACWDETAPTFEDYLGGMRRYLDALLDHRDGREGGSEVFAGILKWRIPCNWKFGAENFLGDHYHAISHRSEVVTGTGPGGPGTERHGMDGFRAESERNNKRGNVTFPKLGHGSGGGPPFLGGTNHFPAMPNNPEVEAYFRRIHEERKERLGSLEVAPASTNTIFPNISFHSWFPRGIAVWHPQGPTEVEVWRYVFVDADAPAEVKDVLRHYTLQYGGPGGMTEQDDMENWNYATDASKGAIATRFPYNYQMGSHTEEPIPGLPDGFFTAGTSETNPRNYYKHWARLMDGESWSDIMKG